MLVTPDPFMQSLGFEVEVPQPGQARVWGTVQPQCLNLLGSAHGGWLYTLADAAFAFAANSHGTPAVALATHMEYLLPAEPGARVEAVALEVHLGHRTGLYRVEVRQADKLIAVFTGTVYRKVNRPVSGATN